MKRNANTLSMLSTFAASLAVALTTTSSAFGFAEDLCYKSDGSGVTNCNRLACAPGVQTPACVAATLANAAQIKKITSGGRSMVHTDATYYMAQAIGLDATTAYWLAAYDEATDLGQFAPVSQTGQALVDPASCEVSPAPAWCAWVTAEIDGVTRMNVQSGGMLVHYGAPYNPDGAVLDGLHPDVGDADHEVLLVNLRDWVYGANDGCTAGLTLPSPSGDYATGAACFETPAGRGKIRYFMPLVGLTDNGGVPLESDLGVQVIVDGAAPITSDEMSLAVGATHADIAKLGVYLHALADRVSHHTCEDTSAVVGPVAGTFFIDYDGDECGQQLHAFRHAQEVGVSQSALPASDRTTRAALEEVYDELHAWAAARGSARPNAGGPAFRAYVIGQLMSALQVEAGAARQSAMIGTWKSGGQACSSVYKLCFSPMPGL